MPHYLFLLLGIHSTISQIKGVTEKGDTIYVYNDGTWSYDIRDFSDQKGSMDFLNEIYR